MFALFNCRIREKFQGLNKANITIKNDDIHIQFPVQYLCETI